MKVSVKIVGFVTLLVSLSLGVAAVQARNTTHYLPIQGAIEMGKAQGELTGEIQFYFGEQVPPAIDSTLTKNVVAKNKTRGGEKNDEEACNAAMLSVLVQLQGQARSAGGNAVINIESQYKKSSFTSSDKFECHSGRSSTVVLKGDIVKLKN